MGRVAGLVGWVLLGGGAVALYGYGRSQVIEEIYREKLQDLVREHQALRDRYDAAVAQTAVTEIRVGPEQVALVLRGIDGVLREVDTDLDPRGEIHVDYVVVDGRLFIRRIYDERTPPNRAQILDPRLAHIDWNGKADRGLSVYRGNLSQGRWVVSSSGNGALDLEKVEGPPPQLSPPPAVRDFKELERQLDDRVARVSPIEILKRWVAEL